MHQVAADGSQIGTGSWFGAPIAQGGFITVYYNRAKLEKLGGVGADDLRRVQAEPERGQGGR